MNIKTMPFAVTGRKKDFNGAIVPTNVQNVEEELLNLLIKNKEIKENLNPKDIYDFAQMFDNRPIEVMKVMGVITSGDNKVSDSIRKIIQVITAATMMNGKEVIKLYNTSEHEKVRETVLSFVCLQYIGLNNYITNICESDSFNVSKEEKEVIIKNINMYFSNIKQDMDFLEEYLKSHVQEQEKEAMRKFLTRERIQEVAEDFVREIFNNKESEKQVDKAKMTLIKSTLELISSKIEDIYSLNPEIKSLFDSVNESIKERKKGAFETTIDLFINHKDIIDKYEKFLMPYFELSSQAAILNNLGCEAFDDIVTLLDTNVLAMNDFVCKIEGVDIGQANKHLQQLIKLVKQLLELMQSN